MGASLVRSRVVGVALGCGCTAGAVGICTFVEELSSLRTPVARVTLQPVRLWSGCGSVKLEVRFRAVGAIRHGSDAVSFGRSFVVLGQSRCHSAAVVRALHNKQLLVTERLVDDGMELVHNSDYIMGRHVSCETIKANNIAVQRGSSHGVP